MRAVHAPPLQRLFGLRKGPKEKILIFGTGAAGKTTYEQLRRQAKVVGFLDNDAGKHGKSLFNKTIYPPRALEELAYDRIVIASMHYEEIMKQLISELRVPPEKVEVSPAVLGGDPRSLGFQTSTIGARIEFARALKNDRAFRLAHLAAHYYETQPLKDNCVFYESYIGNDFAGNPYALFKYLIDHPDYRELHHVIALKDVNHPKVERYKNHPRVTVVEVDSEDYIRYASSCKYFISNTSLRSYLIKKEGQIVVSTWHGTPLKKLGITAKQFATTGNVSRLLLATDYLVSPNRHTTEALMAAYAVEGVMPGWIAEIGYPRNDLIFHADKTSIRQKLGVAENQKVLLFAPTWRGGSVPENTVADALEMHRRLQEAISDNWKVVVKLHNMVHRYLDDESRAACAPLDLDTNELLAVTDLLVTDYSSLFFDFLVTDRPIVFYAPDREAYSRSRDGFYFSLEELPGPVCDTLEQVIDEVKSAHDLRQRYDARYDDWKRRFVSHDDGNACERVAHMVFRGRRYENVYQVSNGNPNVLIYPGSLAPNGITSSFLSLLEHIDYSKYNVVALLPDSIGFQHNRRRINRNVKVFYQPTVDGWLRDEYVQARKLEIKGAGVNKDAASRAFRRNMRRVFAGLKFDTVINFSGYHPSWSAKLALGTEARSRFIFLHNDLESDRQKRPELHGVFGTYPFYDRLICVSEDSLEQNARSIGAYVRKAFGVDVTPKMDFVNNTIVPDRILALAEEGATAVEDGREYIRVENPVFSNPDLKRVIRIPAPSKDHVNFITIGRLAPQKNHLRLLRAFDDVQREHPHVRLYIVGQGPLADELGRFVEGHGLLEKVIFTGYLHNPFPLLKRCDCFVLSSDWEGQGIVILEALTLGKHVISTDIPGPRNILRDGTGELAPPDSKALAEAMRRFVVRGRPDHCKTFDPFAYDERAKRQFEEKVLQRRL